MAVCAEIFSAVQPQTLIILGTDRESTKTA